MADYCAGDSCYCGGGKAVEVPRVEDLGVKEDPNRYEWSVLEESVSSFWLIKTKVADKTWRKVGSFASRFEAAQVARVLNEAER